MTEFSVFEFSSYKPYLLKVFPVSGTQRGGRSKLATYLSCQTGFISHVINGDAHFSLEHAMQVSRFLGHSEDEAHYFLLLIQHSRAGSTQLKQYFLKQIIGLGRDREKIKNRVGAEEILPPEFQATYYSSWHFAAIHVMLSIPKFQSKAEIASHLRLPLPVVSDCLTFLASVGMAREDRGSWRIGETRIHLPADSPLISRHHSNWRLQALASLDRKNAEDLHFSGVYSLSAEDVSRVKAIFLEAISKAEPMIRASPEEVLCGVGIDFFTV